MLWGRLPEPNVPKADLCAIKALQLSRDGQLAIAEDNRGNVGAIATDTGAASWEANLPSYITALQLSPDGQLAIGGDVGGNVRAIADDICAHSLNDDPSDNRDEGQHGMGAPPLASFS